MKLRLGISACLLGEEVRWNGSHRREHFLTDVVGPHVTWIPFCPEDAAMGTPRPTVRLVRREEVRLEAEDGTDHTDAVQSHTPMDDVHGIILKRASPTCGPDVAVWEDDEQHGRQPGIVAERLLGRDIPVTDEGRLREPNWREHFFDQAFTWLRWEGLGSGPSALSTWHAQHKLTLMAHDPHGTVKLGRLAAQNSIEAYREVLPGVLKEQATRGRHANVLDHIQGYVSKSLDAEDRKELKDTIEAYQAGTAPLLVPVTLLRHHARKHAPDWLLGQTYLDPYPAEWMLRA